MILRCVPIYNLYYAVHVQEGPYWSIMLEVSESAHKPVDLATVVEVTDLAPSSPFVRHVL
jgi:hypothetical protein